MTVSSLSNIVEYPGDGVTTDYPIPFPYRRTTDISAKARLNGVYSDVAHTIGEPGGGGGTLTLAAPIAAGAGSLVIWRATDPTQPDEFVDGARFPATVFENALDRISMALIDLGERVGRTPQAPIGDDPVDPLPASAQRAGRMLAFDGEGNPAASLPAADLAALGDLSGELAALAGITADITTAASSIVAISAAPASAAAAAASEGAAAAASAAASASRTDAAAASAAAASALADFASHYLGAYVNRPTTDADGGPLVAGMLHFHVDANPIDSRMEVWNGATWGPAATSINGIAGRWKYIASASQTAFTGADVDGNILTYDIGQMAFLAAFLNGVLLDVADFEAQDGATLTLNTPVEANDEIVVIAFGAFSLANIVDFVSQANGGRFEGAIETAGDLTVDGGARIAGSLSIGGAATFQTPVLIASGTDPDNAATVGQIGDLKRRVSEDIHSAVAAVDLTNGGDVSGPLTVNSKQIRIAASGRAIFLRNDGASGWLLTTAANDEGGSYNELRPLGFDLATGRVTIGNGLTVQGGAYVQGHVVVQGDLTVGREGRFSGRVSGAPGTAGSEFVTFDQLRAAIDSVEARITSLHTSSGNQR